MTPCRRIYAVYRNDERNGRYTACRQCSYNVDSVNIPCKKRAVWADSVNCTVIAFGVCPRGFRRTDTVHGPRETPPHNPGPAQPIDVQHGRRCAKQCGMQEAWFLDNN